MSGVKTALITGITGQDGAYLAEHLLGLGYRVVGTFRRTSSVNFWRLAELGVEKHERLELVEHDLTDAGSSVRLLDEHEPQEVYNLAAQSFVAVSFKQPVTTAEITAIGALNMLEAIRVCNPKIRFYQASSSEMYGKVAATPQDEQTRFHPRSPYAIAKLFAHWATVNYREAYGIFGVSGILFNHESPLRGWEFVTRKITDAVARIQLGQLDTLELGNLDAVRDWGFAREYVEGMHLMMQHRVPDTFVLATGKNCSVRKFVEASFGAGGMSLEWRGKGVEQQGIEARSGKVRVKVNPQFFRPAEVETLLGDAAKAKAELGWAPKVRVETLARMMVEADLRRRRRGASH
jgi:GDPmannose 4,6-dehydratase